jgi:hypothetical protein
MFAWDPRLTRGNLQIIACAGSGKTEFISRRIAYIVANGIAKPENIVAFTFRKPVHFLDEKKDGRVEIPTDRESLKRRGGQ